MKTKEGRIGQWAYKVRGRTTEEYLMLSEVDKIAARNHPGDPIGELRENARLLASIMADCIIASTEKDKVAAVLALRIEDFAKLKDDIASCEKVDEVVLKNSNASSGDIRQPAPKPTSPN